MILTESLLVVLYGKNATICSVHAVRVVGLRQPGFLDHAIRGLWHRWTRKPDRFARPTLIRSVHKEILLGRSDW